MNQTLPWAIKPLVPEEVYTDRSEFLAYFFQAALKAQTRRTMSTVLLGQRRMGKTEIFKRVVNRLFFEKEGQHVSIEKIKQVLIQLSRGDLIDYRLGGWFRKVDDPILVDFLAVWGRILDELLDWVKLRRLPTFDNKD
jgi:hypothetical protein